MDKPENRNARFAALWTCACLIVPALARAEAPAPDTRKLAVVDALLVYCGKNHPVDVPKLQEQLKLVEQGASADAVAEVRKTARYRQIYDAETDFIDKANERNARITCNQSLAKAAK